MPKANKILGLSANHVFEEPYKPDPLTVVHTTLNAENGRRYARLSNGQIVRITYRRSRISDLAIHLARTGRLAEPDTSGAFRGEQLNPFGRKFRKMARRIVGVKGERKEHAFLKAQQALNAK